MSTRSTRRGGESKGVCDAALTTLEQRFPTARNFFVFLFFYSFGVYLLLLFFVLLPPGFLKHAIPDWLGGLSSFSLDCQVKKMTTANTTIAI